MNTTEMLRAFCDAVEQRNGKAFAQLFTEDGVYHDVFYGAFAGRDKIAGMIDDWFYRTATDFRWDMHEPVSDGRRSMRATRSATARPAGGEGARAMFEGVAIMRLRDGKIAEYHEVANTAPAFVDIKFAPERIAKIVARQGAALKSAAGDEEASGGVSIGPKTAPDEVVRARIITQDIVDATKERMASLKLEPREKLTLEQKRQHLVRLSRPQR